MEIGSTAEQRRGRGGIFYHERHEIHESRRWPTEHTDYTETEKTGERGTFKRKEKDVGRAVGGSERAANHVDGREWGEFAKARMDNHRARWGGGSLRERGGVTPPAGDDHIAYR